MSLTGLGKPPQFPQLQSSELLPGVVLHSLCHCQEDIREYAFNVKNSPLSISFCSKGRAAISIAAKPRPKHIMHSPSTCTISYLPEGKGHWLPLTHECNFCTVQFAEGTFQELWTSLGDSLCPELRPLSQQKAPKPFFLARYASPAVRMAFHGLTHCPPVPGSAREMYLGCKLVELLMLLAPQGPARKQDERVISLSKEDVLRIHQARDILETKIEEPPTLPQLARLSGLSEFKLKRGFRQVFATTPYNHLRTTRLNKAREYIENGEMNVCEACMAVGYSNLGNFIDLFKKHFGTTPGVLRKSAHLSHMNP
ncbi:MAG: helix-turn-helix transcriptional regulator [Desulfovibrio sp.]|uniref:helix-turn-helix transcriptional regulator n=1 Tax=Desulfovibrio sp. 7SRBS1 TaxID=3378064 RepID=UPI003B420DB8